MRVARVILVWGAALTLAGCTSERTGRDKGYVRAGTVTAAEVLTGPDADGRAGDVFLENDAARFVVQASGDTSRVFGVACGSVLDAARIGAPDRLAETFPVIDFHVCSCDSVEVVRDGSDERAAVVRVSGTGVPFPMIPEIVFDLYGVPSQAAFDCETDFVIRPRLPVLEVTTRVTARQATLPVIFGDVLLTGYDQDDVPLPGDGLPSYVSLGRDASFAFATGRDSSALPISGLVISLAADAVTVEDGKTTSYTRELAIGTGDAASALAPLHDRAGHGLGRLQGTVRDSLGNPVPLAEIELSTEEGLASTVRAGDDGAFDVQLPAAEYTAIAHSSGGESPVETLRVRSGKTLAIEPVTPATATLTVTVSEPDPMGGLRAVPAKVTLSGPGGVIVDHLPDGVGVFRVAPGDWSVVASRGFEYAIHEATIAAAAGESLVLDLTIERVVDTTGWIAGDFHVHAQASTDSFVLYEERVAGLAAEGVEYAVSTEHDFLADFAPAVASLGLGPHLRTAIGAETSTWFLGHFNSWPQVPDVDRRGRGAPLWFDLPPRDLFEALRTGSGGTNGVVQVNHPRLGGGSYFSAIDLDPDTGLAGRDPTELGFPAGTELFAEDFDAIEVANGKAMEGLFGNPNANPPVPGTIYDWFTLLNLGHHYTFTGNSDSHGRTSVTGYPRNYIAVANDDPAGVVPADLDAAVRAGHVVVSAGPIVRARAAEPGLAPTTEVGDVLVLPGAAADLHVRVDAAPWIEITTLTVYVNGVVDSVIPIPASTDPIRLETVIPLSLTKDSWVAVQVDGDGDLSPVVPGARPLAFTNPIRLDLGGDGWTPPGL